MGGDTYIYIYIVARGQLDHQSKWVDIISCSTQGILDGIHIFQDILDDTYIFQDVEQDVLSEFQRSPFFGYKLVKPCFFLHYRISPQLYSVTQEEAEFNLYIVPITMGNWWLFSDFILYKHPSDTCIITHCPWHLYPIPPIMPMHVLTTI